MGVEDEYLNELKRRRDHYRQRLRETLDEIDRREQGMAEAADLSPEQRHAWIKRRTRDIAGGGAVATAVGWTWDRLRDPHTYAVVIMSALVGALIIGPPRPGGPDRIYEPPMAQMPPAPELVYPDETVTAELVQPPSKALPPMEAPDAQPPPAMARPEQPLAPAVMAGSPAEPEVLGETQSPEPVEPEPEPPETQPPEPEPPNETPPPEEPPDEPPSVDEEDCELEVILPPLLDVCVELRLLD